MKKIFALALTLNLLTIWSSQVSAKVTISAHYREAANVFDILDCVSSWWDGSFCHDDGAYLKDWESRFGLSESDRQLFKSYDTFRKKYFRGLGLPQEDQKIDDGLFAKRASISEDLIAPAFYSSETLAQAYKKLEPIVAADDLKFLREFHSHFSDSIKSYLAESKAFISAAKKLNQQLQNHQYQKFYSSVASYYKVELDINYEVLFTWWPSIERDNATPTDNFLVLRKNPIKHINWSDEDIVFHEIIHTISARQPQSDKSALSKLFLEKCAINNRMPRGHILEEPLAVAIGQIYFLKRFHPNDLKWESSLYSKPWISAYAKLIYPVIHNEIESRKKFSLNTAEKLGKLCNELLEVSASLKAPNK